MQLETWALRWGVPLAALAELRDNLIGLDYAAARTLTGKSEAAAQSEVRLEAAELGARLWRNNVGATVDDRGNHIRYGLANESAQVNARIKSSDLVGIKPVLIGPQHLGRTLGQFCCREVKRGDWRYSGTQREVAQLAWINLILSLGGDAGFATGRGHLHPT